MAQSISYTDQIGDTDDLGDALDILRDACRDLAGAVGVARASGYLTPEARAGVLELIARLHSELDRDFDDQWRDDPFDGEDPYRPGEWNTIPLDGIVCPGCKGQIAGAEDGIHTCECAGHLWRREPGGGDNARWQVLFVDEADEKGDPS
jgi:hypothetical protein